MENFIFDFVFPTFGKLIVISIVVLVFIGGLDWVVFSRRGFDATTACEVKRMIPQRKLLSSKVVCIPVPLGERNDTTTVQIKQ